MSSEHSDSTHFTAPYKLTCYHFISIILIIIIISSTAVQSISQHAYV